MKVQPFGTSTKQYITATIVHFKPYSFIIKYKEGDKTVTDEVALNQYCRIICDVTHKYYNMKLSIDPNIIDPLPVVSMHEDIIRLIYTLPYYTEQYTYKKLPEEFDNMIHAWVDDPLFIEYEDREKAALALSPYCERYQGKLYRGTAIKAEYLFKENAFSLPAMTSWSEDKLIAEDFCVRYTGDGYCEEGYVPVLLELPENQLGLNLRLYLDFETYLGSQGEREWLLFNQQLYIQDIETCRTDYNGKEVSYSLVKVIPYMKAVGVKDTFEGVIDGYLGDSIDFPNLVTSFYKGYYENAQPLEEVVYRGTYLSEEMLKEKQVNLPNNKITSWSLDKKVALEFTACIAASPYCLGGGEVPVLFVCKQLSQCIVPSRFMQEHVTKEKKELLEQEQEVMTVGGKLQFKNITKKELVGYHNIQGNIYYEIEVEFEPTLYSRPTA